MVRCNQWCQDEHEERGSKKINLEAEVDWLVSKCHESRKKCWHVYRQSLLVFDGKNNNDDGKFTNRVYMERTTNRNEDIEEQAAQTHKNKVDKVRRNTAALHRERKWALGPG
jgi:hypothetical protein